jgi:fused signal recognition particle receptor
MGIMDNHRSGVQTDADPSPEAAPQEAPQANESGDSGEDMSSVEGERVEEPETTGDVIDDALQGALQSSQGGEEHPDGRHTAFHAAMHEIGSESGGGEESGDATSSEEASEEATAQEAASNAEERATSDAESGASDEEASSGEAPADEDEETDGEEEEGEEAASGEEESAYDPVAEQRERLAEKGIELGEDEEGNPRDPVDFIEQEVSANEELIDAFESDPQLQEVTRLAVEEGLSLEQAVAMMDLDPGAAEEDPEVLKAQARQEARREQIEKQAEAAREKGKQMRIAFQEKHDYSDEEMTRFLKEVQTYVNGDPANGGQLPEDFLEVMHRGMRYEEDVEAAREEGETKGRNQQINERREKKKKKGDGLPKAPDGSAGDQEEETDPDGPLALAQDLGGANGGVLEGV